MAFTFDTSLIETRDRVRLRLGDTVATTAVFQDESIDAVLDRYGEKEGTAILAESAAAVFMRRASEWTDGDARESYTKRAEQMLELAKRIREGSNLDEPFNLNGDDGPACAGKLAEPDLSTYRTY